MDNPNEVILKSIVSGWFRGRLGDPHGVDVWTPEIESWPRTYYSRSPQGVLVEGFTALMYGMNAISFFISNGAKEDPPLHGRTYWKALPVERLPEGAFVSISEIGAWNAGYIDVSAGRVGGRK